MTQQEKVEEVLRKYSILKSKAQALKMAIKNLEFNLQATDYSRPKVSGGSCYGSSEQENFTIKKNELALERDLLIQNIKVVERVIDELNETERVVVRFKYFKGKSDADSAARLDCSVATIQNRKRSALDKLVRSNLHYLYQGFMLLIG